MPQARDEDGNIWEVDAQGNAIALIRAANAGGPQMPADPTFPHQGAKIQAEVGSTVANAQGQQIDNRVAGATVGAQITSANADATAKTRTAQTAGLPEGFMWGADGRTAVPIPGYTRQGLSPEIRSQAIQVFKDADALERAADEIEKLYRAGPGATKGIYSVQDYLPTASNKVFNDAGQQARGYVKRALGFTGGEGNTVAESGALYDPYLPSAGDRDEQIERKIGALRQLAKDAREKSALTLGGVPDENGAIRPNAMTQTRTVAGDPLQAAAFGATEGVDQYDPAMLQAYEALVGRLLIQGGGKIDPQAFAAERAKLNEQFGYSGNTQADIAWATGINDHLGKGGKSVPTDIRPPERELSTGEFLHHSMVNNPVGAALVGAGDMGSFGAVSALSGDDVRALGDQGGWTGAGLTLGQVAGSVYGAGNAGKLAGWTAGKLLPSQVSGALRYGGGRMGNIGRDVGTDAFYSGTVGTAQGEDPLNSAVFGAGGSLLGRGAAKVTGGALGGITASAPVQALRARGIPLTGGRILGDTASKIEDKMASWPIVGDMIGRRHQDSFEGLSRAMFDEGGAPIGFSPTAIGREGVEQFRTAKGQAFDNATAGVSVPEDAQFSGDLVNIASARAQLPDDLHPRFDRLMENHTSGIGQTGALSGEAYQRAMRGLKTARGKAGTVAGEFEEPYREALSLGMDAFDGLMRRGGGESVVQGLNAANVGHKNFKIIEDAIVNRARNGTRAGEVGLPAPSQWVDAAAASERKYGANTLRPIAEDAQRVLPSSVPNSGTADRLQLAGLGLAGLGAAGGGEAYATGDMSTTGKVAAALAILTAGGTRTGQKALAKALLDRPDALKTTGKWLNARSGLFGRAMIPMTLPDSYQP